MKVNDTFLCSYNNSSRKKVSSSWTKPRQGGSTKAFFKTWVPKSLQRMGGTGLSFRHVYFFIDIEHNMSEARMYTASSV